MGEHELVNIPKLLFIGGLVDTPAKGSVALRHGRVKIEQWTIGIAETDLPRWVLRGVSISVGERSMRISPDGTKILRPALTLGRL